MQTIGDLVVKINGDTADLESKVGKADISIKKFERSLTRLGVIFAAVGGGIVYGMKKMVEQAEEMTGGTVFAESMSELQDSLNGLTMTIGDIAAPIMADFADKLRGVVDWFQSLNRDQQDLIVKTVLFGGVVLLAIGTLGFFAGSLLKIGTLAGEVGKFLGTPGLAGKIGALAGPIALITAFLLVTAPAWKDWGNAGSDAMEFIKAAAKGDTEAMKKYFKVFWIDIELGFMAIGESIVGVLNGIVNFVIMSINAAIDAVANLAKNIPFVGEKLSGLISMAHLGPVNLMSSDYEARRGSLETLRSGLLETATPTAAPIVVNQTNIQIDGSVVNWDETVKELQNKYNENLNNLHYGGA